MDNISEKMAIIILTWYKYIGVWVLYIYIKKT